MQWYLGSSVLVLRFPRCGAENRCYTTCTNGIGLDTWGRGREMSVYQIAIFADGADSYAATLRATIRRSISDLGIPSSLLSFLNEASVSVRDRKSPTVGAFFGLVPHPAPAAPALSDLPYPRRSPRRADSACSRSFHRICTGRPAAYQRNGPSARRSGIRAHRFCASGRAWSASQEPATVH